MSMNKSKAIFLDRDGTINVEKDYLYRIEDFEFMPGVIDALQLLQSAGYLLIIITNQSGIARGYYSIEDFLSLNAWMMNELKSFGVNISSVYYCPHHPAAKVVQYRIDCNCRKPQIGLYERAKEDYNIDFTQSYAIGDKIRDCAICKDTDCKGFLVNHNEKNEIIEAVKSGDYCRVEYADSLLSATKKILSLN